MSIINRIVPAKPLSLPPSVPQHEIVRGQVVVEDVVKHIENSSLATITPTISSAGLRKALAAIGLDTEATDQLLALAALYKGN